MALRVVQKFGGSSVADVDRIRKVAERVKARRDSGFQVVVVVSAMGDTTDELLQLAKKVTADPPRRELDMLLTCGERISMALMSMALQSMGVPAISFTGSQSGIITDTAHARARILEVRPARIEEALACGKVVIVAGYQGVSREREVTTLGRGGSDTSAVALAAALGADCEIYSDVDGVYSADPRIVTDAKKLSSLSFDEMQELAAAGAKVLNAQAVEYAKERDIQIHAKSTFGGGTGTLIGVADDRHGVKGITCDLDVWVLCADDGVAPLLAALKAQHLRARNVWVDERTRAIAVVSLQDIHSRDEVIRAMSDQVQVRSDFATVTCVGVGLMHDVKVVDLAVATAQRLGVAIQSIYASGLQMTLLVAKPRAHELTIALHSELLGTYA